MSRQKWPLGRRARRARWTHACQKAAAADGADDGRDRVRALLAQLLVQLGDQSRVSIHDQRVVKRRDVHSAWTPTQTNPVSPCGPPHHPRHPLKPHPPRRRKNSPSLHLADLLACGRVGLGPVGPTLDNLGAHDPKFGDYAVGRACRDEDGALGPERERGVSARKAGVPARGADQGRVGRAEGVERALGKVADATSNSNMMMEGGRIVGPGEGG